MKSEEEDADWEHRGGTKSSRSPLYLRLASSISEPVSLKPGTRSTREGHGPASRPCLTSSGISIHHFEVRISAGNANILWQCQHSVAMPTFCGNEGIGKAMPNMVTIPKIEKVLTSLPRK